MLSLVAFELFMLCVSLLCTMILLMLLAVLLIPCFIRLFLIYPNVTTSLTKFMMTWCFQTVVLEKTLKSPLDSKEIKTANPKGNPPWIFIGRTDAETPILSSPDVKGWPIGKDPDAGKDWGQEEKWVIEDEMVGWHHRLNGHEFEQIWEAVKDRGAWHAVVRRVTKSWTQLSHWTTVV